jgi:hypothetical protein
MSGIKIEDPAAAEGLTPEQEGLVAGARLRPFHPTRKGLETPQLMDAGIGGARRAPLPAQGASEVAHVAVAPPLVENTTGNACSPGPSSNPSSLPERGRNLQNRTNSAGMSPVSASIWA